MVAPCSDLAAALRPVAVAPVDSRLGDFDWSVFLTLGHGHGMGERGGRALLQGGGSVGRLLKVGLEDQS